MSARAAGPRRYAGTLESLPKVSPRDVNAKVRLRFFPRHLLIVWFTFRI